MDLLKNYLNPNFKPIKVDGGETDGQMVYSSSESDAEEVDDLDIKTSNYAEEYKMLESAHYAEINKRTEVTFVLVLETSTEI